MRQVLQPYNRAPTLTLARSPSRYYAPWCQSCFTIKPLYERTAGARLASTWAIPLGQTRARPHVHVVVHCMCICTCTACACAYASVARASWETTSTHPSPTLALALALALALTLTEGKMGDHVDFYEVDGGCARELVALADVRKYPVRCE